MFVRRPRDVMAVSTIDFLHQQDIRLREKQHNEIANITGLPSVLTSIVAGFVPLFIHDCINDTINGGPDDVLFCLEGSKDAHGGCSACISECETCKELICFQCAVKCDSIECSAHNIDLGCETLQDHTSARASTSPKNHFCNDHNCIAVCFECNDRDCTLSRMWTCTECDASFCTTEDGGITCHNECSHCEENGCPNCGHNTGTCTNCEEDYCDNCLHTCSACDEQTFCEDCKSRCIACKEWFCQTCTSKCTICEEDFCDGCDTSHCAACNKLVCEECIIACSDCESEICPECVTKCCRDERLQNVTRRKKKRSACQKRNTAQAKHAKKGT